MRKRSGMFWGFVPLISSAFWNFVLLREVACDGLHSPFQNTQSVPSCATSIINPQNSLACAACPDSESISCCFGKANAGYSMIPFGNKYVKTTQKHGKKLCVHVIQHGCISHDKTSLRIYICVFWKCHSVLHIIHRNFCFGPLRHCLHIISLALQMFSWSAFLQHPLTFVRSCVLASHEQGIFTITGKSPSSWPSLLFKVFLQPSKFMHCSRAALRLATVGFNPNFQPEVLQPG